VRGDPRRKAEFEYSEVIAPEHMLLALLAMRRGLAARAIANLAGSSGHAQNVPAEALPPGRRPSPAHIRFTLATEQTMVRAAQQARLLGDEHIGTEHLLLGLFSATNDAAACGLLDLGITYDAARAELGRLRAGG
jgi:ATP-dependent Clp protease ATP-binding subunit ClpA